MCDYLRWLVCLCLLCETSCPVALASGADDGAPTTQDAPEATAEPAEEAGRLDAELRELVAQPPGAWPIVAARYDLDRGSLLRSHPSPLSPARHERLQRFSAAWLARLAEVDADALDEESRREHRALVSRVRRDLANLRREAQRQAELASLMPFAARIVELDEARRRIERVDGRKAADTLHALAGEIDQTARRVERQLSEANGDGGASGDGTIDRGLARRAGQAVLSLRGTLRAWHGFYDGYDPLVTWWVAEPYKAADAQLERYARVLGVEPREAAPAAPFARGRGGRGDAARGDAGPDDRVPAEEEDASPSATAAGPPDDLSEVPDLAELLAQPRSEMRPVIQRYQASRGAQRRGGSARGGPQPPAPPSAPTQPGRDGQVARQWIQSLAQLDFEALSPAARVDYLLLKSRIERDIARSELQAQEREHLESWLPIGSQVAELERMRRRREPPPADEAVRLLDEITKDIRRLHAAASADRATPSDNADAPPLDLPLALKVLSALERRQGSLAASLEQLGGADPAWAEATREPAAAAASALNDYRSLLTERFIASRRWQTAGIEGDPIGREALLVELAGEMIPYTPEELLAIAEREYAWCLAELKRAAAEMGLGDDWRAAVERVKGQHVPPGEQPLLIRDLAREAIDFVTGREMVSVPPIAAETWRMQMMSPQRQLINPFFTGGETISVSYPTSSMSHESKLQSMRGNNIPFARATVHHELIPGHHLQGFMTARYQPHRGAFNTPFWGEGWAVYWEMLLYDRGFVTTPQDRVGMLFWRMFRCGRIVFSLRFHLGEMSPQECIDYLVTHIGHERENATAEVRRSFGDRYSALYQAAYLLGALQFRELHRELCQSGPMTEREFHDAVLRENRMPIAMLRAVLTNQPLTADFRPEWRFYPGLDE